jgi:hypothetical protein
MVSERNGQFWKRKLLKSIVGAGRPGQETRTTNFKCTACDIPYFDCLVSYREHRREHDSKYVCKLCGHTVTTGEFKNL